MSARSRHAALVAGGGRVSPRRIASSATLPSATTIRCSSPSLARNLEFLAERRRRPVNVPREVQGDGEQIQHPSRGPRGQIPFERASPELDCGGGRRSGWPPRRGPSTATLSHAGAPPTACTRSAPATRRAPLQHRRRAHATSRGSRAATPGPVMPREVGRVRSSSLAPSAWGLRCVVEVVADVHASCWASPRSARRPAGPVRVGCRARPLSRRSGRGRSRCHGPTGRATMRRAGALWPSISPRSPSRRRASRATVSSSR